jgi:hypothetical protein
MKPVTFPMIRYLCAELSAVPYLAARPLPLLEADFDDSTLAFAIFLA